MFGLHILARAAVLAAPIAGLCTAPEAQSLLPARIEGYLGRTGGLTAEDRRTLAQGGAITRLLEADPAREVGVLGVVWVAAPMGRYVSALVDIERFESGGAFKITRKIGEPARLDDFAAMRLTDEDARDIRSCRVGACQLKLGEDALSRVRAEVDWSRPDSRSQVEAVFRALAVDYVNAYREGGNARLAVYRDRRDPTFVETEFRQLLDGMPELATQMPAMRQFLLDYPRPAARPTTSFLYWQEVAFGLKPTIRINHVGIQQDADATLIASKLLYSSHYFWTALEVRALVPDPARGPGFWLVSVSRSRSDGLSGFTGRLIRGRVRDEARRGLEQGLAATKRRLEE